VTEEDKQEKFHLAVDNVVNRFREEFDMTFVSMMGVLQLVLVGLACEAWGYEDEDEDDDEGEEWKITFDDGGGD
jgi:nitrogen fixation-related uncharacterized protein